MAVVSCEITGGLGDGSKFWKLQCTVFFVKQQGAISRIAVYGEEVSNNIIITTFFKKDDYVIINEVNFYLHSSYASVGLRQMKVKSVQCKVLGISEFEIANYSNWS